MNDENNNLFWYITIRKNIKSWMKGVKINQFRQKYKIELDKFVMIKLKLKQIIDLRNEFLKT